MNHVLITGANRGIGLEFCRQYLARGWRVSAVCRQPDTAAELQALQQQYQAQLALHAADITSDSQCQALAAQLAETPIDVLLNNAGIYGPKGVPLGELDAGDFSAVLATNAVAPILFSQRLLANLQAGRLKKLVFVSSKMASIADNSSGGSYYYRAAKCALNAAAMSFAKDTEAQGIHTLICHPGWVQTDMGGPNALINTQTSVTGLIAQIDDLSADTSGRFVNFDGQIIPW